MANKNYKLAYYSVLLLFLVSAVFIATGSILAWVAPTSTAPNNNVATPLNVGTSTQSKEGVLTANGSLGVTGSFIVNGNILKVDGLTNKVQIADGTQGANKVLTSDTNGVAGWAPGLPVCLDAQILKASSTAPSGWICADGFTYAP